MQALYVQYRWYQHCQKLTMAQEFYNLADLSVQYIHAVLSPPSSPPPPPPRPTQNDFETSQHFTWLAVSIQSNHLLKFHAFSLLHRPQHLERKEEEKSGKLKNEKKKRKKKKHYVRWPPQKSRWPPQKSVLQSASKEVKVHHVMVFDSLLKILQHLTATPPPPPPTPISQPNTLYNKYSFFFKWRLQNPTTLLHTVRQC